MPRGVNHYFPEMLVIKRKAAGEGNQAAITIVAWSRYHAALVSASTFFRGTMHVAIARSALTNTTV